MRASWLLETDTFDEDLGPFYEAIVKQHLVLKKHGYTPSQGSDEYLKLFAKDDCVVFHGSLEFAAQIMRQAPWVPGVYCNFRALECSNYYAYLGKYLLNQRYAMMPYGDLYNRREFIFDVLGHDGVVFIRPSSGAKLFRGQLLHDENFDEECAKLCFYEFDYAALVVVAEPVNLTSEWRLVVCDKKIVASSLYRDGFYTEKQEEGCPPDVLALGEEIAAEPFQPDPAWVLDIARTKAGDLRLIEINSFSCSGMYACDKQAIVREVSAVAVKEWVEHHA